MPKRKRIKNRMQKVLVTDVGERKTGTPWMIAYVYSRTGKRMVAGASNDVTDYINRNHPRCFYRATFWKNERERNGFWTVPFDLPMQIAAQKQPHPETGRMMWRFTFGRFSDRERETLWFRRMPNKWLDIFDHTLDYVDSVNGWK